jgi:hypothetical protein
LAIFETPHSAASYPAMQQSFSVSRRRRWPWLALGLLIVVAALWSVAWHYATGTVERTIAGWKEREARAGRVYTCASQTIGGFPFGIEVRCADAGAELRSNQPPLALKAKDILVHAQVWQPTRLTSNVIGPLAISEPGAPPTLVANWQRAQSTVHGLPVAPERVDILLDQPALDHAAGSESRRIFTATRLELNGRMLEGSATDNPVIEVILKLAAGVAPGLHPATANPIDADVTAVLRGLKDFRPKPWPARFRELQAAGGRIEVHNARLQQGETVAVANGVLGLSPRGRLDGQLRLTVANLEALVPALGLDRLLAPRQQPNQLSATFGALDRLAPGLGRVAQQNAGPALVAGLSFIGQPTDLEGRRAITLPLRFSDGMVSLGPIQLGQTAPLF